MQPEGDEEVWEVIVSPDDIKLLTLEQLDDMFRLDVISASTLVRQKGTSSWQRLGVVAGIEDDDAAGVPAEWNDSVAPPAPAFGVRPKPVAQRAPSFAATAHPFWGAGAAQEALPLLDVDAPIMTAAVAEPAFEPPSFDSLTRTEAKQAQPAPFFTTPRVYAAPRSSPLATGLVLVTAILGVLWALHRNDTLRSGAGRLGLAAKYDAFEKTSLGKPGFGTPRALEAFLVEIGDMPATASPASSAVAVAVPTSTAKVAEKPKTASPSSDGTKAVSLDALPVLPTKTAAPESAPAPAGKAAPAAPPRAEAGGVKKAPAASEKVTLDEAPAKPQKPENPLQAAIRQAMEKQNKKK